MIRDLVSVIIAATVLAAIAPANAPQRVEVIRAGAHTWHVVGTTQYLISADDGAFIGWCDALRAPRMPAGDVRIADGIAFDAKSHRFVSTRGDVDVTWSAVCPD